MAVATKDIISLVVAALLAGILLPIGLTDLVNITNAAVTVNGSASTFGAIAPASIITLLGVVVPIVIVIGVMMGFLRK
jgi:lipopolysaccharide export LptBFGC system permease protein LptF